MHNVCVHFLNSDSVCGVPFVKSIAELKRKHFPSSKTDVREINSVRYFEQIRAVKKSRLLSLTDVQFHGRMFLGIFCVLYFARSVSSRYA